MVLGEVLKFCFYLESNQVFRYDIIHFIFKMACMKPPVVQCSILSIKQKHYSSP